jgi:hypothetical protein
MVDSARSYALIFAAVTLRVYVARSRHSVRGGADGSEPESLASAAEICRADRARASVLVPGPLALDAARPLRIRPSMVDPLPLV